MKLDNSVLERLNERIEMLSKETTSTYSIINKLKDVYIGIIKDGQVNDDIYLDLASFVLYVGFLAEE